MGIRRQRRPTGSSGGSGGQFSPGDRPGDPNGELHFRQTEGADKSEKKAVPSDRMQEIIDEDVAWLGNMKELLLGGDDTGDVAAQMQNRVLSPEFQRIYSFPMGDREAWAQGVLPIWQEVSALLPEESPLRVPAFAASS